MADTRRRELERAPEDPAAALGARLRAGELSEEQVALLAYLEVPGASQLLAELDPLAQESAWRTWSFELEDLALLSSAADRQRFTFGRWPGRVVQAVRSLLGEAARELGFEAALADPDFPQRISPALAEAARAAAHYAENFGPGDATLMSALAEAHLTLQEDSRRARRGERVSLELQAIPPLCRILGRKRAEHLVRERIRESVLREEPL